MDRAKDIEIVKESIKKYLELLQLYHIKVIDAYLFGSYSRGDADENSDIDILVELDYSKLIGLEFVQMQ
jgi:predicted nucleotidyltransferase